MAFTKTCTGFSALVIFVIGDETGIYWGVVIFPITQLYSLKLNLAECLLFFWWGHVTCEEIEKGHNVLENLSLPSLCSRSLFFCKPYFPWFIWNILCKWIKAYCSQKQTNVIFFSSYLRIQFFELYFSCKEGLLYTLTYVRQILRNVDGISSHSLCHNGIIL